MKRQIQHMYFIIGFRNIAKNIRKNALTLLMISFGMTALFIYDGSNASMFGLLKNMVINKQYGSFQIHKSGYAANAKKNPYDYLISDYSPIAADLRSRPSVDYLAPRLYFSGLISSDARSSVISGFGGSAEAESRMEFGEVSSGTFIHDGGKGQAILGELALKKLSAKTGDSLTMLVSMKGGGVSAADLEITGTKKSSGENDAQNRMFILADLASVQSLMGINDTVDTIIVQIKKGITMESAEKDIASVCAKYGLEYKKWTELAVFYESVRLQFNTNRNILTAIILLISIFIIINTLYMSFMERMRETGTIRALGTTKLQVTAILVSESAILSAAGGLLGILAGLVIAVIVNLSGGIYHPVSVFNDKAYYTLIQPEIASVALYWLLFVIVAVASSVFISFRALKLSIADSLRWN